MLSRKLKHTLLEAAKTFPAMVVTGPRQSGKTTLLKSIFGATHTYLSLENPDVRLRAKEDPIGLLKQYKDPVIFDEIQYVPELFSYIKDSIDANRTPARFVLTGSQNFLLMEKVAESLAGRAAVLTLLPLSLREISGLGDDTLSISGLLENFRNSKQVELNSLQDLAKVILRGSYPEPVANPSVDRQLWYGSYVNTYLERDVRNLERIGELSDFERFVKSCAIRTGQVLNLSDVAKDVGISLTTAKRWLSLLETGYQVFLLYPYYKNLGKRLVKSPKIYFCDTGVASYLMGLNDESALINNSHFGNLFETLIVTDFLKRYMNFGRSPSLYYLRTRDKLEIDLVLEESQKLALFEMKSGSTITPSHVFSLKKIKREFTDVVNIAGVISGSSENFNIADGIKNFSWRSL
mgnify:CR=1 FL=1